jgi:hypothetical protein
MFDKNLIRVNIKFLAKLKKTAAATFNSFREMYEDGTVTQNPLTK